MAFTYTPGSTTPLNRVRFLIGDTDSADPQVQDEEIQAWLNAGYSVHNTSVEVCRALSARYARFVDKWVGDLKILASQRYRQFQDRVKSLTSGAASGHPIAGGIYVSDKENVAANVDLVKGSFAIGMHDNT
ncbi:MAG: hypothetical protein E6R03_14910 [Hyphomicrobiaceae bacterium]|nr:MAG: hypothetical protein E6R03_14910 [Hyphomicrobiaceae bacterium]